MSDAINISALAAETGFTERDLKNYLHYFQSYAKDKTSLNALEFRESLGLLGFVSETVFTDLLFNAFNTNKDNKISFEEYIRGVRILTRGTPEEKLAFSFRMIDINGKGYITLSEFELVMESTQRLVNYVDDITKSGPGSVEINKKTTEKLFHDMDKDGNGQVTCDEFVRSLSNQNNITLWMSHISNNRDLIGKEDMTTHLPFFVHRNLSTISQQATEVLNTLSTVLTLTNSMKAHASLKSVELEMAKSEEMNTHIEDKGDFTISPETVKDETHPSEPEGDVTNVSNEGVVVTDPSNEGVALDPSNGGSAATDPSKPTEELIPSKSVEIKRRTTPEDELQQLTELLRHAVSQQFNVLRRVRKFMDTMEKEALGRSREYEHKHALPPNIRSSLVEANHELTAHLEDSTAAISEDGEEDLPAETKTSMDLKEQVKRMLPGVTAEAVDQVLQNEDMTQGLSDSSSEDMEEEEAITLQNKHHPLQGNDSKGLIVHFTHEKWDLVVNIMMGIRKAVSNVMAEPNRPLCSDDYIMKEKMTLAPQKSDKDDRRSCRFVDYAPMVFRKLRENWNIPTEEYMLSVGPQQILRRNIMLGSLTTLSELCSEGKSGSFFYYSADGKYMVKTISHAEHRFFRKILAKYYSHIVTNPDTLLVRFLGAHQIRFGRHSKFGSKRIYFVVMGNLFDTPFKIERRYDLKGSWAGRYTPDEKRGDITRALKDLDIIDLDQHIRLDAENTRLFNTQLEKDSKFLADCGIIDYSLLLGVHTITGELPPEPPRVYGRYVPFWQKNWGGVLSDDKTQIYYMGVIDILIHFNARKFGELAIKSVYDDAKGVSVQFPSQYQKRFMKFMLQLSDPAVKQVQLGKGFPKKLLKKREQKKKEEEEARESVLTRVSTVEK